MIEADLTTLLMRVCPQTYPTTAPKSVNPPFMIYTRVSTSRLRSFDGPMGMAMPMFQVDIYASDFDEARQLAGQVRSLLDGYRDTKIADCSLLNEQDMSDLTSDPALSRVMLEFRITHQE